MNQEGLQLSRPLMKVPKALDIDITAKCNLRCKYCSHFDSPGVVEDLPTEEWLRFFKELRDCTIMNVTLAGGEPFLRKDFQCILQSIIDNKMRFSILSNGSLINDEIAAFISSSGRCNSIQISLDGSNSDMHDVFRCNGSFSKALEGIRILRKYHLTFAVRVTIHRHNVHELESISRFLLEELQLRRFSTNEASHLGTCRNHANDIQLTIKENTKAMDILLRLNKKYNGRIFGNAGPLAKAKNWLSMEKACRTNKSSRPNQGHLSGCRQMWNKLAVRADGVIVPCSQLSHIDLGRINQNNLKDLWQNHVKMNALRQRHKIPLSQFKKCRTCEYVPYCTGNCPAIAYTFTGDVNRPSPDSCLKQFLENGGELPDETSL